MDGHECVNCPDSKWCPNCKRELPASAYHVLNAEKGYLQSHCKACARERSKASYHRNKDRYIARAKDRDRALDVLINERKSAPCMDCGVSYPPFVMDFDHRDGSDKHDNISRMRRGRVAFAKIIAEMDKCDVVCANCHRIRTNARNPARYMAGDF